LLLRSTLLYAPAIFLTRISALLLLVIATRLIDQTEYGLLTLVVTVGEMTDVAVGNWLRISLLRLGGKGQITTGSLLLAARVLVVTTLLSVGVSVAASGLVAPERWSDFALAVSAYLVVGSVGRFALTILQMQQRHGTYALLEFLRAMLQLALPVLAIVLFANSFLAVSLASSLGTLVAGLAGLSIASGRLVAGPPRFTHRALLAIGLPLIGLAVVGFGLNSVERVLLKIYYDAGAVAIFAAAYALSRQPIDMIANAINMGSFPEMVSRFDEEGPDAAASFLSRQMSLMAHLSFPVAAMLVALSGPVTALVLPADYHGATAALFPIIALSVLATNFGSFVFDNVVHAHKKPWLLIFSMAPGSVVTVGLSLLLIPPYAEMGAALALCGGAIVSLCATIFVSRRLTPVPTPWTDLGLSVGVAAVVGIAAFVTSAALAEATALVRLVAGGCAGGLAFLALTTLLHPHETLALARTVRLRLGRA
jgi:O-antigen/teichoic acid export membrane protein